MVITYLKGSFFIRTIAHTKTKNDTNYTLVRRKQLKIHIDHWCVLMHLKWIGAQ